MAPWDVGLWMSPRTAWRRSLNCRNGYGEVKTG